MAGICRENNLVPWIIYGWKEKFLAGGRISPEDPGTVNASGTKKRLRHPIGEYAVASDVLKSAGGQASSIRDVAGLNKALHLCGCPRRCGITL